MEEEKYKTLRVGFTFWTVPEGKFQKTNRVANKAVENYLYPKTKTKEFDSPQM